MRSRAQFLDIALACFITLQIADFSLTTWATGVGYVELNPVLAPLIGTWLWPLSKIGASLLGVALLKLLDHFTSKLALSVALGLCGLTIYALNSNLLALIG
ncbi:MAG: hypothetical protein DRI26_10115 [Chloroflexi bacterium]|nr:MAG: hypothetical protein DRI26_10115 [Chloroflexota bacterium]